MRGERDASGAQVLRYSGCFNLLFLLCEKKVKQCLSFFDVIIPIILQN